MNTQTLDTAASTVRSRQRIFRALQALLILAVLLATGAIALFGLDNLFHLGSVFRIVLGIGVVLAAGAFWVRRCLNPLLQPLSREEAVIMIERAMPELDNRLINAERLGRDNRTPVEILSMIRAEALQMIAVFDLRKVTPMNPLRKLAIFAGGSVVALLLYAALLPEHFNNAFKRYTQPTAFIPPITRTSLSVSPGNVTAIEGDSVTIKAEVGGEIPSDARVHADSATHVMRFVGSAFVHEFSNVESPFSYSVQAGDAQSEVFKVTVLKRCKIERLALTYTFPEYLKLPPRTDDPSSGAISAVEGTRVALAMKTNKEVRGVKASITAPNTIEGQNLAWNLDVKKERKLFVRMDRRRQARRQKLRVSDHRTEGPAADRAPDRTRARHQPSTRWQCYHRDSSRGRFRPRERHAEVAQRRPRSRHRLRISDRRTTAPQPAHVVSPLNERDQRKARRRVWALRRRERFEGPGVCQRRGLCSRRGRFRGETGSDQGSQNHRRAPARSHRRTEARAQD